MIQIRMKIKLIVKMSILELNELMNWVKQTSNQHKNHSQYNIYKYLKYKNK